LYHADIIALEHFVVMGHENIRATHKSTFEFTKENYVTPRGDCIIGIRATKGFPEYSREFIRAMQNDKTFLEILLFTDKNWDRVVCRGSKNLKMIDEKRIIVRKSQYINGATLCINSNKSAADINRELIREMRSPEAILNVVLIARHTL
jgi:hypothetical protein